MELSNRKAEAIDASVVEADQDGYTRDERDLVRLGKKPVLKRNFGFMQILGFSCTVLVTWEGILSVSTPSLLNGGPAGVFWGYLLIWIGSISVYTVLSELASMAPTAGGQYHWVAMLAPPSSRKFLSYITGWVTLIGWQATTASSAYLGGSILQSVVLILHPDYSPKPYQAMLLGWTVLAFAVIINTVGSKTLAHFEGLILILHVLGFFAILIPLVYLAPHSDASIFTTFVNSGGWSTQGLSFMVGLPSSVFALVGVDSCVHMAEEVKDASRVVPRAILISVFLNGALGLAMMVAYLFCIGNLQDVLENSVTLGYAYLYVFLKGTGSPGGAMTMALLMWFLGVCCLVGLMAATSRQMWSFARDNAVPFSSQVTKVHPKTRIPVTAIFITAAISILLSFIALGSYVAFSNVVNLSIGGLYASYFIVCSLLLGRRLQGISAYNAHAALVGPDSLQWGPWKVPGIFGVANNLFACCYLLVLWFFSFWPGSVEVDAQSMNFSSVTFGGTVLFAIFWYYVRGRKTYRGPIIE
ncbi:GABA permease [Pyrenophora tritici-repentis]|nr:GABA permease [Pyrenophora tritici-repentis]KAI1524965.1 PotE Amino acid transporter [Pyrenophora tritici-repentis]KAI1525592.1 PotE Amino acid transporter [Pyrenophora tritici-repentis]KAI1561314.1 PotE Amino acid transporter [Pyrenophora tritici-repentis]KAI1563280.1 PotE Amino acid transporter [Pyrenophora tritici-repentis]